MPDELTELFRGFEHDVSGQVRLATADQVRGRGDRHRVRLATTSVLAVSALTGVSAVGGTALFGGRNGSATRIGGNDALPTHIPAGLNLPHEGEPGWNRDNSATTTSAFTGCATVDPTMPGRVDARTMTGPGLPVEESHSPTRVTEQLFLYDTQQSAELAIAALSRGVATCHWIDSKIAQLSGSHIGGGYPNVYEERVEGIQVRNAVFLIRSKTTGRLMSSIGSAETSLMADRLCNSLHLCRPPAESPDADPSGMPNPNGSANPSATS